MGWQVPVLDRESDTVVLSCGTFYLEPFREQCDDKQGLRLSQGQYNLTEDFLWPGLSLLMRCESCRENSLRTSHKDLFSSGQSLVCSDFSLLYNFY